MVLDQAVEDACKTRNVQCTAFFLEKVQQLYEMIVVRHGLMLVGLPFAGKTTCYRVLADALALIEERVGILLFYCDRFQIRNILGWNGRAQGHIYDHESEVDHDGPALRPV